MIKSSEHKLLQMQHWTNALIVIFVDQHCTHQYNLSTQRKRRERQADRTNLPRACAVLIQQRKNNAPHQSTARKKKAQDEPET